MKLESKGEPTITLPSIIEAGQSFTVTNNGLNPIIVAERDYRELDLRAMGYVKYKKPWWKLW